MKYMVYFNSFSQAITQKCSGLETATFFLGFESMLESLVFS